MQEVDKTNTSNSSYDALRQEVVDAMKRMHLARFVLGSASLFQKKNYEVRQERLGKESCKLYVNQNDKNLN